MRKSEQKAVNNGGHAMKEFRIHFTQEQFEDLHSRLGSTRMPVAFEQDNADFGVDCTLMQDILEYWRTGYDWYCTERQLNRYPQFVCEIDGMTIHFFHIPGNRKNAVPILLTHGWPDSFLRYAKVFPLLSDYDLVVPSLPGFAFSTLPQKGFTNNAEIAEVWHKLMTEVLGYRYYVASGGDMGRGVTCFLAARHPGQVQGIHLTDVGLVREIMSAPEASLEPEELDYKQKAARWMQTEAAYINVQGTKPRTLAYALSDSPSGMAAWITEKYRAWSDWPLLAMDDVCNSLTLYWMTNTAGTSIRVYHGNSFTLPPSGKINVPTAIASFKYDVLPAPRRWIEGNYPVVQYTEIPHGGHFTALEQPQQFADSLISFIQKLHL